MRSFSQFVLVFMDLISVPELPLKISELKLPTLQAFWFRLHLDLCQCAQRAGVLVG